MLILHCNNIYLRHYGLDGFSENNILLFIYCEQMLYDL